MKLLRIIASADPRSGGPIEGVLRLGEILAREGHDQHLVTLDPPEATFLARVPGTVFALGRAAPRTADENAPHFWRRYGYSPHLAPWLRAHLQDYDAAIVSGLWNYATLAARRALLRADTPYVVFTHGMLDPWFRRRYPHKHVVKQLLWPFSEGPLLRHAGAVLFTSDEERRLAERAFVPYAVKPRVVTYGTAAAQGDPAAQRGAFEAVVPALAGRPFLLFLSRIHVKKGCDLLVEAFGRAAREAPDLQLVIAGPDQTGQIAALRAAAAALGVADRVHFPGMISGDAKWGAFRSCEAFVLPSHQENFGIAVVEAAACGAAVLISDKVNIWREFVAADAGLVEPDTTAGITRLLTRFLALDAAERTTLRRNALALFRRRFEISAAAHDLLDVLRTVIADRHARG